MSTLIERHRQLALRAKGTALWQEQHWKEEPFVWNGYGGEVTAYPCGCGKSFTEESELDEHLAERKETR